MSGSLKVGGSELINDSGGSGSLQWGSGVPAGSVLQVKQQKSDAFQNITGDINTMINISGLNTSITIGANNKVLVQGMISCSSNYWAIALKLKRGIDTSTLSDVNDALGDNTGYTNQKKVMTSTLGATASGGGMHNDEMSQIHFSYIDSPNQSSSSTIHYGVFVHSRGTGSQTIRINAPYDYTDNNIYITRGISTLILSEIQS